MTNTKNIKNEVMELDVNELENISGGKIYIEYVESIGEDVIVVEGIMKNGRFGRMYFDNTDEGMRRAIKFANNVGISTEFVKK